MASDAPLLCDGFPSFNLLNVRPIFVSTVCAVERHLAAVAADLEAAKQSVLEWQTRFETAAAQNTANHGTALLTLRQELEDTHRIELEKLASSC